MPGGAGVGGKAPGNKYRCVLKMLTPEALLENGTEETRRTSNSEVQARNDDELN